MVYHMPMNNFQNILAENGEKDRNCYVNRARDGWIRRKINTIQPYIELLAELKRTQVAEDIPTSKDNIICKDGGGMFCLVIWQNFHEAEEKTCVEMYSLR